MSKRSQQSWGRDDYSDSYDHDRRSKPRYNTDDGYPRHNQPPKRRMKHHPQDGQQELFYEIENTETSQNTVNELSMNDILRIQHVVHETDPTLTQEYRLPSEASLHFILKRHYPHDSYEDHQRYIVQIHGLYNQQYEHMRAQKESYEQTLKAQKETEAQIQERVRQNSANLQRQAQERLKLKQQAMSSLRQQDDEEAQGAIQQLIGALTSSDAADPDVQSKQFTSRFRAAGFVNPNTNTDPSGTSQMDGDDLTNRTQSFSLSTSVDDRTTTAPATAANLDAPQDIQKSAVDPTAHGQSNTAAAASSSSVIPVPLSHTTLTKATAAPPHGVDGGVKPAVGIVTSVPITTMASSSGSTAAPPSASLADALNRSSSNFLAEMKNRLHGRRDGSSGGAGSGGSSGTSALENGASGLALTQTIPSLFQIKNDITVLRANGYYCPYQYNEHGILSNYQYANTTLPQSEPLLNPENVAAATTTTTTAGGSDTLNHSGYPNGQGTKPQEYEFKYTDRGLSLQSSTAPLCADPLTNRLVPLFMRRYAAIPANQQTTAATQLRAMPTTSFGSTLLNEATSTNIFIGRLPPYADEFWLLSLLGVFGNITSVKIMWPRLLDNTLHATENIYRPTFTLSNISHSAIQSGGQHGLTSETIKRYFQSLGGGFSQISQEQQRRASATQQILWPHLYAHKPQQYQRLISLLEQSNATTSIDFEVKQQYAMGQPYHAMNVDPSGELTGFVSFASYSDALRAYNTLKGFRPPNQQSPLLLSWSNKVVEGGVLVCQSHVVDAVGLGICLHTWKHIFGASVVSGLSTSTPCCEFIAGGTSSVVRQTRVYDDSLHAPQKHTIALDSIPSDANHIEIEWPETVVAMRVIDTICQNIANTGLALEAQVTMHYLKLCRQASSGGTQTNHGRDTDMTDLTIPNENNPIHNEFGFLWDPTHKYRAYYQWRIYSFLRGDGLETYSLTPFQMFADGPFIIPPSLSSIPTLEGELNKKDLDMRVQDIIATRIS